MFDVRTSVHYVHLDRPADRARTYVHYYSHALLGEYHKSRREGRKERRREGRKEGSREFLALTALLLASDIVVNDAAAAK